MTIEKNDAETFGIIFRKPTERPPAKTKEEFERRRAVDFALANSEFEGYKTSDEFKELMERVAIGEISIEDVRRSTEERFAEFFIK